MAVATGLGHVTRNLAILVCSLLRVRVWMALAFSALT